MKISKKFLSMLLTAALVLSLLPSVMLPAAASTITVGTATELNAALVNAIDGDVIELTTDISGDISYDSTGKAITIDGQGHKITGSSVHALYVSGSGSLLLKSITLQGPDNTGNTYGLIVCENAVVQSESTVTAVGGTPGTVINDSSFGVWAYDSAIVKISAAIGGTATLGHSYGIYADSNASLDVDTAESRYALMSFGIVAAGSASVNVDTATGGTAAQLSSGVLMEDSSSVTVGTAEGGTVTDYGNSYGVRLSGSSSVTVGTARGGTCENGDSYGVLSGSTGSVNIGTAIGGTGGSSTGLEVDGYGCVNVCTAIGGDCTYYSRGIYHFGSGAINAGTAVGGNNGYGSYGVYNDSCTATVNVTQATGGTTATKYSDKSIGVYNSSGSSGTSYVNVGTANAASADGYGIYNHSGTINVGTVTVGQIESGAINTLNTGSDCVSTVTLKSGTGTSCVLDAITVAASGTTSIGRLPCVTKDGNPGTWYSDAGVTTEFTGTTVTGATSFYSTFYPIIDLNDTTTMPDYVTFVNIYNGNGMFTINEAANEAAPTPVTIMNTGKGTIYNTVAVASGVTGLTLILDGISIASSGFIGKIPIDISSSASVTIIPADGTVNTLDASNVEGIAGLCVPSGATVTITGGALGTGTLYAYGGAQGAGIGGGYNSDGGTITISGGTVSANSSSGAGIGGGYSSGGVGGAGGKITISSGTVSANSSIGAGIGGGYSSGGGTGGAGGEITISGGTVNATSIEGAGIGGGYSSGGGTGGAGGKITISSGTVNATSELGAGIGGGEGGSSNGGTGGAGGEIKISGGTVVAKSNYDGAGIGGGMGYIGGAGGIISISGGTIDAMSYEGSGIGGGWGATGGAGADITISGGTVTAKCDDGAGIGAGTGNITAGSGGTIAVSGGRVTAISTYRQAMSVAPTLTNGEVVSLASANADGSSPSTYSAASIANYKYLALIPILSGTVTLNVNPSTGEVTASVSGGNTASAGTLTYTWSGGASGTGTTMTPTPGTAATCTVTSANYNGSIQASVTVYQVTVTASGATGTDSASITDAYGLEGDSINIAYTLDSTGTQSNTLTYSGAESNPTAVTAAGSGTSTYTIASSDTASGTINLTATFMHTNIPLIYTATVNPTSKTFAAAEVSYGTQTAQEFTITNTGTGSITSLSATLGGSNFEISTALSDTSVASNGTATVSVRPKTELSAGDYTDTLTITGDNSISLTVSLSFTVNAVQLDTPTNLAWDGTTPGKATWDAVSNVTSYTVQLYKDGSAQGSAVTGLTATEYDFTSGIASAGTGSYTFKVSAIGDGTSYTNSDVPDASAAYSYTGGAATYTITASAGSHGTISPSGSVSVSSGGSQTFTITANGNYSISSVTVDSVSQGAISTYTFSNVSGNHTISATFTYTGDSSGGGSSSRSTQSSYSATMSGDSSGKLTVTVDEDAGSASAALSDAQGKLISGGKDLVITLPEIDDVTDYILGIPVSNLSSVGGTGSVTMSTGAGSVTLHSDMLTGTDASGDTAQIELGLVDSSELSDEAKAAVGDRSVVSLTLYIDGKQTDWSNSDAPVTVSIPYTPAEVEDLNAIVIWYIDGDGNLNCVQNGHYDSETGTVTFQTTHFSLYAVGYNGVSFSDVSDSAWYADYVAYLAARGIVGGNNGAFSPDSSITRAEFVTILARMSGDDLSGYTTSSFTDVIATDWYFAAVQWAYESGVATGSEGKFDPNAAITREQMAAMLYRYADYAGDISNAEGMSAREFNDYDSISSWAQAPIQWAVNNGIITGNPDSSFAPASNATRAQAAKMIAVMLQSMIES